MSEPVVGRSGRGDPPTVRCALCGRGGWDALPGKLCKMPQPDESTCAGRFVLVTPPVPATWYRDEPPRDLRERFIEAVFLDHGARPVAEAAWQLIMDAWRVIDVASARGDCPPSPNREEWFAALRVAIFRADHPEATSTALDGS